MDSNAILLIVGAACVGIPVLIGVAAWMIAGRWKARAAQKKIDTVNRAITEYFRNIDVTVSVNCVPMPDSKRMTVFIESEPMKQMRLSHIIETSLRDLVHNLHRIELDKIYWRFPIKNRSAAGAAPRQKKLEDDNYITEGLSQRHLPKADVEDASWEHFEQVSTRGPKPE